MQNKCCNGTNNMSDLNTGCPTKKVQMSGKMFVKEKKKCLQPDTLEFF